MNDRVGGIYLPPSQARIVLALDAGWANVSGHGSSIGALCDKGVIDRAWQSTGPITGYPVYRLSALGAKLKAILEARK